jgi:hypothetical protein
MRFGFGLRSLDVSAAAEIGNRLNALLSPAPNEIARNPPR